MPREKYWKKFEAASRNQMIESMAMQNLYNILLVTDSRGRELSALLNRANPKLKFHVDIHPGARISNLIERIK